MNITGWLATSSNTPVRLLQKTFLSTLTSSSLYVLLVLPLSVAARHRETAGSTLAACLWPQSTPVLSISSLAERVLAPPSFHPSKPRSSMVILPFDNTAVVTRPRLTGQPSSASPVITSRLRKSRLAPCDGDP